MSFLDNIAEIANEIESLEKSKGEGSRGGHIIGHTKSGKPIYRGSKHQGHKYFTPAEHKEVADLHAKVKREDQKFIDHLMEDPEAEDGPEMAQAVRTIRGATVAAEKVKKSIDLIIDLAIEAERMEKGGQGSGKIGHRTAAMAQPGHFKLPQGERPFSERKAKETKEHEDLKPHYSDSKSHSAYKKLMSHPDLGPKLKGKILYDKGTDAVHTKDKAAHKIIQDFIGQKKGEQQI